MDLLVKLAEYQTMETERLILRPVSLEDTQSLFEYASNIENTTHVFPTHLSKDETREAITKYYLQLPLGKYGIILKENDKFIGTIDLRLEVDHKRAEIGYVINLKYSGNGYVTEAANQLLKLSFEEMGLNQVKGVHSTLNPKSGQVMKRLGMKKVGVMPKNRIHKDKIVDDVIYAITDNMYKENNKPKT